MIDAAALLADTRKLADRLVDDLRERTESHNESRIHAQGVYSQATAAGRTDKTFEEWREDLLAQVAAGWVLGCVFIRFCEDNGLYDTPLLAGPGDRRRLAGDHRAAFFADDPTADDRDWLREVFGRYATLPGTSGIFGKRNPLWQLTPGPDGAKALMELWWATDDEGRVLRHDFADESLDTRFLGDLYQDLSEHARKQYALLQTPEFVEEFILDRTLDPAIETFGLAETRIIDPTCGSGHFLLGAFDRLLERWQQAEPGIDARELTQRTLDAVNGVDINPFAVAIARFRLLVAALLASSIRRLEDAPNFRLNIAVGDSLLHGTAIQQTLVRDETDPLLRHRYPSEDGVLADQILGSRYGAVVGNPPYITVEDRDLSAAYRDRYSACHGQYSLGVPFTQRFFDLAHSESPAGFVGMITSNSFMTRSFGKKLIEDFFARSADLSHIVDTSGAIIPGHGTPTILLFGRSRTPSDKPIRAALGIQGEPGLPDDAAQGMVWLSIVRQLDSPGSESAFISVADVERSRFKKHPWSLQGGASPEVKARIEEAAETSLASMAATPGYLGLTSADQVMLLPADVPRRLADQSDFRTVVRGEDVRDWSASASHAVYFPYDVAGKLRPSAGSEPTARFLWPYRTTLWARRTFDGGTYREAGRPWWQWHQLSTDRVAASRTVAFAQVATHNNFVPSRGWMTTQTAPLMAVPEEADDRTVSRVVALLNSSVAEFWVKQVCHNKGAGGIGGGIGDEAWEPRYQRDGKVHDLPIVLSGDLPPATALAQHADDLDRSLSEFRRPTRPPTAEACDEMRAAITKIRERLIAFQEELDWACYHLYRLTDQQLTSSIDAVPLLKKGERAFEIALARRMAAGEATSTWFDRHGSTPITELPAHWPDGYRQLVERRLELLGSDRAIGLLERPEYKRRWNWAELPDLERDAQRQWLLDRLEALLSSGDQSEPEVTTIARLADQLLRDDDARAVLEDLEGAHADPVKAVGQLVASAGVPFLAAMRLKESGLRTRQAWERTWALQRVEDDLDARAVLPADHADHLDASSLSVAKKEAGADKIPVPPKFKSSDFRDQTSWRLRGKLDVPKERFVLYPRTHLGADTSPVLGWAGWDHLQQMRALAGLYTARKQDGAEVGELMPLLAGMAELLPWVLQWHDDPDPVFGDRMGQYFTGFLDSERAALGLSADDLTAWRP